jgi:hypothetical protein
MEIYVVMILVVLLVGVGLLVAWILKGARELDERDRGD